MQRRFAVIFVLIGSLALPAPGAFAAEPAPDAPRTYVVRPGDTLWDIAGRFLRDPWRWSEVWRSNPGVEDPDRLYPGDRLELTLVEGRPVIARVDGDGPRVVRLSPQVRSETLSAPVPTIPVGAIAPFLTQPYVADSDDIERAFYVVGFPDEHIVAGVHDEIYVRKIRSSSVTQFQILRPGEALRDPDSGEVLGYQATFVANAVLERTGDPAKLRITRMEREAAIGDRVVPVAGTEQSLTDFMPKPGPAGTRGRILSVMNGVSQIGQYDVVVIDLGTRDQVERGHVFDVFVGGEKDRDQVRGGITGADWLMERPWTPKFWFGREYEFQGWREDESPSEPSFALHPDYRRNRAEYVKPFERSGRLMVFRVFDRVGFGLVLNARRALRVGDWIAPPPA